MISSAVILIGWTGFRFASNLAELPRQGRQWLWTLTLRHPSFRSVPTQVHQSAYEMKRNLKPFTVEIKKSRVHSQNHQLPPKRLFATVRVEVPKTIRPEEPQAVAEQPAPRRILPSIVEPVWSRPEPVEPVRRRRLSGSKARQAQIALDLDGLTFKPLQYAPAEASVLSQGMSRTDVSPVVEEDVEPVDVVHIQEAEVVKAKPRKPRRQASAIAEQVVACEPVSEPALALETDAVGPSPAVTPRKLSHHGLTRRQAASAQLPRHERWKRRLHPACW
jgi:hypothetical protein